jgi:MFS family permease
MAAMASVAVQTRSETSWGERLTTVSLFFTNGLAIGAWAASIPFYKARIGLSDGMLSLALAALLLGSIISMPVVGPLAARFGSGRALRLGALLFSASLLLPVFCVSLPMLMVATFLIGLTNGAVDVAMNTHAADVERRWGSPIMSSFHAAFSVGGLAGAAIGGLMAAHGWTIAALPAAALIGVGLAVLAWMHLQRGTVTTGGGSVLALPTRALLPLCLICLLCMMCEGAMLDWSAVYLSSVVGAGVALAATGYAAFSAAMIVGRLSGDTIVRIFGPRRVVQVGGTLGACGLALAVAVPTVPAGIIGFLMVGLGVANNVPVIFSAGGRFSPLAPARGIAMVATAGYAGMLAGPPIVGGTATLFGLRCGIGLVALCLVVAVLLAGTAFRPRTAS